MVQVEAQVDGQPGSRVALQAGCRTAAPAVAGAAAHGSTDTEGTVQGSGEAGEAAERRVPTQAR